MACTTPHLQLLLLRQLGDRPPNRDGSMPALAHRLFELWERNTLRLVDLEQLEQDLAQVALGAVDEGLGNLDFGVGEWVNQGQRIVAGEVVPTHHIDS